MGDPGLIPGSGRSPEEGNGNPLQYSCLENSMDGGAWWATVHGVAKSRTWLSDFTHFTHSLSLLQRFLGETHSWHPYFVKNRALIRSYLMWIVRVYLPLTCTFSELLLDINCCWILKHIWCKFIIIQHGFFLLILKMRTLQLCVHGTILWHVYKYLFSLCILCIL